MSSQEPQEPSVYQPYGVQDEAHWVSGRIYGVQGVNMNTTLKGLTKKEAEDIARYFRDLKRKEAVCPSS